ncbi:MAG: hypothetical protein PVH46_09040 [Granulosicoccaceae bacterium]
MLRMLAVIMTTLLLAACTTAPHTSGRVTVHGKDASATIVFSDYDRRYIYDYYRKHHKYYKKKRLPPGLAKRQQLPPGLAKRDRLPPGLQGHYLPHDLDRHLTRLPSNFVRLKIGRDIVLMDARTRVIFDIILDVD